MKRATFARAVACAVACAALALPARAQQQNNGGTPPAPPSLYTPEQATRGEKVYVNVCVECHEKLEYTGPEFRAKWNTRPVFELFDLLRTTMPDENPGTLTAQEYADVVGYMMKLNGVLPGKAPLPADADALKKLKIVIPK